MTVSSTEFLAIEIDDLDVKLDARLAETARRKRIPSLTLDAPPAMVEEEITSGERLGGDSPKAGSEPAAELQERPINRSVNCPVSRSDRKSVLSTSPGPAHRPETEVGRQSARRRPLSLEVPDYLARELKVKAATEGVTVRFLVLRALVAAGFRVDQDELEEDGRRLR